MMFTDTEIGLDFAHARETRARVRHAQGIIDRKTSDIELLMVALQAARNELARTKAELIDERAKRLSAEHRLERILDLEL